MGRHRPFPEMVAAFVRPNDPAVDHILKAAAQVCRQAASQGSIDGYTHGAKRAWNWPPRSGLPFYRKRKLNYALPRPVLSIVARKCEAAGKYSMLAWRLPGSDPAICILPGTGKPQPVACLHHGHAFVGLWLRDESSLTAVVDDITAVRKPPAPGDAGLRDHLGGSRPPRPSFAIFKATASCPKMGMTVQLVVDVKRARMSRIKPTGLGATSG